MLRRSCTRSEATSTGVYDKPVYIIPVIDAMRGIFQCGGDAMRRIVNGVVLS